jgi:hypothetical protein
MMEGDTSVLIVPEFMHLDISENRINAEKPKSVSTIWSPETCKSKIVNGCTVSLIIRTKIIPAVKVFTSTIQGKQLIHFKIKEINSHIHLVEHIVYVDSATTNPVKSAINSL